MVIAAEELDWEVAKASTSNVKAVAAVVLVALMVAADVLEEDAVRAVQALAVDIRVETSASEENWD